MQVFCKFVLHFMTLTPCKLLSEKERPKNIFGRWSSYLDGPVYLFLKPPYKFRISEQQCPIVKEFVLCSSLSVWLTLTFGSAKSNKMDSGHIHSGCKKRGRNVLFRKKGFFPFCFSWQKEAPARFELTISCLLDRRFNQLSHGAFDNKLSRLL